MISVSASAKKDFKLLLDKTKIISEEPFGQGSIIEADLKGTKILFVSTGYHKINLGLLTEYVSLKSCRFP